MISDETPEGATMPRYVVLVEHTDETAGFGTSWKLKGQL